MTTLREMFERVVLATEANILDYLQTVNPNIVRVHFQYGHAMDIISELKKLQQPQAKQYTKYPLIAVFEDILPTTPVDGLTVITPKIIIANLTKPEYNREQRDELNFKPILIPLYDEFTTQLKTSGHFSTNYKKTGSPVMRPFWGKEGLYGNEGNVFDDALDCIEVRGFELTIRQQRTCVPAFTKNF